MINNSALNDLKQPTKQPITNFYFFISFLFLEMLTLKSLRPMKISLKK